MVSETLGQHSQSHGGGGRHKERARKDTLPGDYNPEYTVKLPAITRRVLLLFLQTLVENDKEKTAALDG